MTFCIKPVTYLWLGEISTSLFQLINQHIKRVDAEQIRLFIYIRVYTPTLSQIPKYIPTSEVTTLYSV